MNLSKKELTEVEKLTLEKGLNFVPTQQLDKFKLNQELNEFFRRIRLHVFFKDQKGIPDNEGDSGLHPKSDFNPPTALMPVEVLAFEQAVMKDINEFDPLSFKCFHNFSKAEKQAAEALGNDGEITIKPADKGGAIVIQNTEDYRRECLRLLADTRNYKLLKSDPSPELRITITSMVEQAVSNRWITKKEGAFLITKQPRIPYFYTIPKIHKDMTKPPGRPIVSGLNSILEPLSKYADSFLRPILQKTATYLKDTKEVLNLLNTLQFDSETDYLVSLDVESLYTSLPQTETLRVIEDVLFKETWDYATPRAFIMECVDLALTKNFFQYEDSFYLQVHGTSMGSTFAPSVAGLYVHHLETCKILSDVNPYLTQIKLWKRYIDDVLMIWSGTEEDARKFLAWLNNQDAYLKFTSCLDKSNLVFLDLNLSVSQGMIKTDTHFKPTARNSLLNYKSFHPKHLRDNLPFGQFLRLRRNCSNIEDYKTQADFLSKRLIERDYPTQIVQKAKKRARNNNRESLLEPKHGQDNRNPRLTCITTYTVASTMTTKTIQKHWRILNSGNLNLEKPLISHKRGRNLKDTLVHTRPKNQAQAYHGILPKPTGHYPCGNCSVCKYTKVTKSVDIGTNRPWELRFLSNCNTERVVYLLTCPCHKQYVGMTTRKVKIRLGEHRSNFRCKKNTTKMTLHFLETAHTPDDFTWVVLEHVSKVDNCETVLFSKEQRWIFRLGTNIHGLNDDIPWGQL